MALTSGTKPMNNCLVLIFAFLIANLVMPDMFRQTAAQDPFDDHATASRAGSASG